MKEIEQRAKKYAQSFRYLDMEDYDDGLRSGRCEGYVKGAKEQRNADIEKACEWLKANSYAFRSDEFLESLIEAMKGE